MKRPKVLGVFVILTALALLLAGQVSGEPAGDDVIVSGAKAMLTKGMASSSDLAAAAANTEPHTIAMYADAGKLISLSPAPAELLSAAGHAEDHVITQYADANRLTVLAPIPAELQAVAGAAAPRIRYQYADAGFVKDMTYPKPLFNDATPPVISNIRAVGAGQGAVAVLWTTDEFADSRIEYGLTPGAHPSIVSDPLYYKEHRVVLTGLTWDTTYYFVITSADRSGNVAHTGEGSFTVKTAVYLPLLQRK